MRQEINPMNAPILTPALKLSGKDERKLSMKAAREAQNGLDVTFINVKGERNGLIVPRQHP
ncbi:hypothetical protein [Thioclava dalianensis]|uniref:hypothetical protein n=1 Tax=Thioclava dalianensis TaxID=1185766 RepID=UPI001160203E|nr:hypothetical protein [Thioclava dalianensis]